MRTGNEPVSGLYYEVLGESDHNRPPVLMIHGGGATGGCFRGNLAGGTGWADRLAARGHEVWVTDWPGCGRSGGRHLIDIEYADVVDGYRHLLREVVGRPAIIVPHSMGGATTWQLVEHEGDLVLGVVAIAASYPGNAAPKARILAEDGNVVRARFEETGVEFTVDLGRGYLYEDDYVYNQAIATSTRFPRERIEPLRAGFSGLPPKMLLQRIGVLPGLPAVEHTTAFAGLPIRLIAGTEDPAHRPAGERATAALFRSWGADAAVVNLGELGLKGNGHFLFYEDNEQQVLDIVAEHIAAVMEAGAR
ncbi:alpha/beta hydrolase [Streptomyces sp. NPDC050560]|uniref:alpha/beta hydrolase n=1 Tax=Streptomyces sp. NPDC050560 TaxID=3365630 RepID=UPI00378AC160